MLTKRDIVYEHGIECWQVKDNVNTQNADKVTLSKHCIECWQSLRQCQSIKMLAKN